MSIIANGSKIYNVITNGTTINRVNATGTRVYEKVHKAVNQNSSYGRYCSFGTQIRVTGGAITNINRKSSDNYSMGWPSFVYESSTDGRVFYDSFGYYFTLDDKPASSTRSNRIVDFIEFDVWPTYEPNDHTATPIGGWTIRENIYVQWGFATSAGSLPTIQSTGANRITFQEWAGTINTSDKHHFYWDTGGINSDNYPIFFIGMTSPDYRNGNYNTADNIYLWIGNVYIYYGS